LFETDTDCLFGVSARRPHPGFNYFSTGAPRAFFLFILVVLVIIAESNLILHAPQHYNEYPPSFAPVEQVYQLERIETTQKPPVEANRLLRQNEPRSWHDASEPEPESNRA
jgi:hypothetical protein